MPRPVKAKRARQSLPVRRANDALAGAPFEPLSPGSGPSPCSCRHKPLVSLRINRQFSGWNLPPLIRDFGGALPTADIGSV
jgi:hypothetical protein